MSAVKVKIYYSALLGGHLCLIVFLHIIDFCVSSQNGYRIRHVLNWLPSEIDLVSCVKSCTGGFSCLIT